MAEVLRRHEIGITDLLYKAGHGYHSYSPGGVKGTLSEAELHDAIGLYWHRDLWSVGRSVAPVPCG